jgi:hypothetical protein
MQDQAQFVARYQRLLQVGKEVNQALIQRLSKTAVEEGARRLGLFHNNAVALDRADAGFVMVDYCIHDVRTQGRTVVEELLGESPYPPGSDEAVFLGALKDAYFSLFLIEGVDPGVGVRMRDLARSELRSMFDVNLSRTGRPGVLLATRLITPEGIVMSTGATLSAATLPEHDPAGALRDMTGAVAASLNFARTPEERSEATAMILSAALQHGASSRAPLGEPRWGAGPASLPGPRRQPPGGRPGHVGRNSPCPCGSGKKFKQCCGRGR